MNLSTHKETVPGNMPSLTQMQVLLLNQIDKRKLIQSLVDRGIKAPRTFNHTSEPIHADGLEQLSELEHDQHQKIYHLIRDTSASTTALADAQLAVDGWIRAYPNIPSLHNFAFLLRVRQGRMKEAHALLQETLRLFPDYLFAKLSLAEYYLNRREYPKVLEALEHKLELQQHFPAQTDTFHVTEAVSFYNIVGMYHAETGDLAQALLCYLIVTEIDTTLASTGALAATLLQADLNPKITHKNHLDDFFYEPEPSESKPSRLPVSLEDPEAQQRLVSQMNAAMPIIATPTKALVRSTVGETYRVKANQKLKITEVIDMGDRDGITCVMQVKGLKLVSLTHLLIDKKHPLYKAIRRYQLNRIKVLAAEALDVTD